MKIQSLNEDIQNPSRVKSFRPIENEDDPSTYGTKNVETYFRADKKKCPNCSSVITFESRNFMTVCNNCGIQTSREADFIYQP